MQKPYLFFDFDGVKFDTMLAQVVYINDRYGIQTVISEHIGNNSGLDSLIKKHRSDIQLTRDQLYFDFGNNFLSSIEWHKHFLPFEDMCEVIQCLAKKYTLVTVTARLKISHNTVSYLLDKYVPGCISQIHYVWERNEKGEVVRHIPKKEFLKNFVGEKIAFFDDSPEEILETQHILPSYLFDPENIHTNVIGIRNRVLSWKQIGEIFL